MTSRALFYKGMIEDLRHKIWMIALSCLASFMAMPVSYLLMQQGWEGRIERWIANGQYVILEQKAGLVHNFFTEYLSITCGIVLFVGALIVGILGFRHVFSKKMVDLYHSIPIKRAELFVINYLNGFLIWFVPMIIGAIVCAWMALAFIGDFSAWVSTLGTLAVTIGNLVLAFLLVYHLAIVAVMLSGNILNTLINGTILSFGVLALYGMFEGFACTYYDTYYSFFESKILNLLWVSPPVSSIYQLAMRCNGWNTFGFVMNLIMVVVLLATGFVLYLVRPSELAEQGMKVKWVQVVFKTAVTVLAGMAGWIFFGFLTDTDQLGWLIFGAVFGSVLTYGILDIIFHMDFKAFFKHKIQMGITTLASIIIGCVFLFDLTGFDTYVPDTDDIANMGIYVQGIGYNESYQAFDGILTVKSRIESMRYTDKEAISAFLNQVVARERENDTSAPLNGRTSRAYVRVMEKSGKTYYRMYRIAASDEQVIVPILTDTSYVETNMIIPKVVIDHIDLDKEDQDISLENEWDYYQIEDEEFAKELFRAYNIDVAKHPEWQVYQKEEIFAELSYRNYGDEYCRFYLDLHEGMENVIAVLEKYGYSDMFHKINPEEVEQITIEISGPKEASIGQLLGLEEAAYDVQVTTKEAAVAYEDGVKYYITEEAAAEEYNTYTANFTDKKDIAKLLDVISFMSPNYNSLFQEEYSGCSVIVMHTMHGRTHADLKLGVFPEELLGQFGVEQGVDYYY